MNEYHATDRSSFDQDDTLSQSDIPPLASRDSDATHRLPGDSGHATSIGLVRTKNDDRWGQIGQSVFVVADGMGGYDGGDKAAMAAVEAFIEHAAVSTEDTEWDGVVREVNRSVREVLRALELDRGGTTLLAAIFESEVVTLVHVGDSRAYRYREGELGQLTTDHTLLGEMQAIGMTRMPAGSGPIAKGLTSYIGIAEDLLRVDVQRLDSRDDDVVVLCSDGVHGQIPIDVLTELIGGAADASTIAGNLVTEADGRGGRDNATAVVIRV